IQRVDQLAHRPFHLFLKKRLTRQKPFAIVVAGEAAEKLQSFRGKARKLRDHLPPLFVRLAAFSHLCKIMRTSPAGIAASVQAGLWIRVASSRIEWQPTGFSVLQRDSSHPQAGAFARSEREEKTSACSVRNDNFRISRGAFAARPKSCVTQVNLAWVQWMMIEIR